MVKRIFSLVCLLMALGLAQAQTPMPLDPKIKHGTLPNGMTYYVLHNEEPKGRANFYIAQKVGSTLETPEQLGLAHFLEHMAFNGTSHYPGKAMLNYLQNKGIRFGADINAYTSFDETVYNINNVPTSDKALMDSVLLVLHDWSGSILLEESEIEAERGVIREEWRQRDVASLRALTNLLPQVYSEYQYQQMPIGKMDIVMNFAPETLRAYYKKWYRPDQQGIVIIGDFDADEMEQKVIKMFSPIEMPADAAPREYAQVSRNQEPIYAYYDDPELRAPQATISFKREPIPAEFKGYVEAYLQEEVLQNLIAMMINTRLSEYSHNPDCKYVNAGTYFSDFYVSKTLSSFNVALVAKSNVQEAIADVMGVVARACKTGFTMGEMQRAVDQLMSSYEKAYNERDKTDSDALANQIIDNFTDGKAYAGIETEYELIKQVLPSLPVQVLNEFASTILTPDNEVIAIQQPRNDSTVVPEKAQIITTVKEAIDAQYEAMPEETVSEPLISKKIKEGKIKKTTRNAELGTTEYLLSNGAKVIIKPTDFSADQILMQAYKEGGKRTFSKNDAAEINLIGDVYDYAKYGTYDLIKMQRFLSGKKVSLGYEIANYTNIFNGESNIKDFETLLSLLYVSFTDLNPDKETLTNRLAAIRPSLLGREKDPSYIFSCKLAEARYGNNPLMDQFSVSMLDAFNYDKAFQILKEQLSNAGEYTFIFTGNVTEQMIEPLIKKYIASMPGKKAKEAKTVTDINQVAGQVNEMWKQPMSTPSTNVFDIYSGTLTYDISNQIKVALMGDILDIIYTETLREEEGGTYGAAVAGQMNPNTDTWSLLYTFQTNKDQQESLINRAHKEFLELMANGADLEKFNKVKEAALKQYENNSRTNAYWLNGIFSYQRGWNTLTGHQQAIQNLTLEELNNFMKNLYNGQNRIQVIMEGVPVEK